MRVFNLTISAIRLRLFVIIAISTLIAIVLATSADTVRADGITWTTQTYPVDNRWISVTWGGQTGEEKFVAVASSGTGDRVMTSPDGITWTTQTSAADNNWRSVVWGGPTGQQKFVAVASTGTGNRVMTSPDGITWTTQTSAADNYWRSVVWGGPTGKEKFVAVARCTMCNSVMTSPDGITWTTQTSAVDNEWTQVAWGGPTGQQKFVAVANSGTGDRVMTSGLTASAPSAPTINSITSGDSSLTVSFTAAADGGSPIMNYKYSTDGVTYSALNPASTSSPFTISGLTNGTAYSVTIKAVNAIGDSVASNIFAGTPTTTTVAPTTTTVAPKAEAPTTMPTEEKAQSLPVTGDDSLNMVFIGLFFVIGGIVFSRLRRIV